MHHPTNRIVLLTVFVAPDTLYLRPTACYLVDYNLNIIFINGYIGVLTSGGAGGVLPPEAE